MSDQPQIPLPRGGLAYLTDTGTTVIFTDAQVAGYGLELTAMERAVLVVRLRGWADQIEQPDTTTRGA